MQSMLHSFPATICRLVPSGRVWLCDDDLGVSRTPIYALAQDPHGCLWLGTEDGPALFDGLAWSTPASLAPLAGRMVRALAPAPDRVMWVATDTGLARVDLAGTPYRVTALLTAAAGLPSERLHTVHVDRRGEVWAGTHAGLALIEGDAVRRILTEEDGLPSEVVWSLCDDPAGRLWIGTKGGLAVLVDGVVRRVETGAAAGRAGGPGGAQVVRCDTQGRVWVALVGGGVLRVETTTAPDPEGWALRPVHAKSARIRTLRSDGQTRLLIGAGDGVTVLEDDTPRGAWTVDDGLPAKEVYALHADGAGRTWAGTGAGLALLEDDAVPLRAPAHPALRAGAPVYACAMDRQGRMWLGSEDGVAALDPMTDRPASVPAPPALAGRLIWALHGDAQGRLWAGTDSDGLLCVDPDNGAVHAHFTLARHVPVLCQEGKRRLWAAFSGYGVARIDIETGAVLQRVGVAEGLPGADVQALQIDATGRLWVGTWGGWLARIDPERGTVLDTRRLGDDVTPRPVSDLSLDAAGLLWVSTYGGGLLCLDPAQDGGTVVRAMTTRDGLPSDLLYACTVDRRGHIWMGTRRGVARYTPMTGRCLTLGRSLGLPSEECNGHALCLDQRERLWVGTVGGVGVVEVEKIAADVPPCPVYLTGFTTMGRDRALVPALEIEDSDYDLVFSYGAVTFTAAPQVTYRAQLVGLEEDWSPPTPHRFARYTNLRPGAYTFRVAARNWGGQWSAPVEASFRVIRNRAARELEKALERERIDKEVAQATAAVFERLALQDGLTGLLNRRALDERLAQEVERARRHGHPLTMALADVDHFKRINDTFGHQVGDEVLKAVARLCLATARGVDSVGRYGGEEIALVLPETTGTEGMAVCERLRRTIEGYDWAALAPGLHVTISIGLSDRPDAPHPAALVADADTHLYQAKQGGRNRTCCVAGTLSVAYKQSS